MRSAVCWGVSRLVSAAVPLTALSAGFTSKGRHSSLGWSWGQKKNLDEVSEEEIDDIIRDLVLNLDQGAIKFLKISDGNKTLYEDSNDKPYHD